MEQKQHTETSHPEVSFLETQRHFWAKEKLQHGDVKERRLDWSQKKVMSWGRVPEADCSCLMLFWSAEASKISSSLTRPLLTTKSRSWAADVTSTSHVLRLNTGFMGDFVCSNRLCVSGSTGFTGKHWWISPLRWELQHETGLLTRLTKPNSWVFL